MPSDYRYPQNPTEQQRLPHSHQTIEHTAFTLSPNRATELDSAHRTELESAHLNTQDWTGLSTPAHKELNWIQHICTIHALYSLLSHCIYSHSLCVSYLRITFPQCNNICSIYTHYSLTVHTPSLQYLFNGNIWQSLWHLISLLDVFYMFIYFCSTYYIFSIIFNTFFNWASAGLL